ncbi:MAG: hypothetical protein JWP41_346 [Ramlibacter sp.]|jgi:hypothetical protein|nr:hypothetical protein [Ramlibacter sp.]
MELQTVSHSSASSMVPNMGADFAREPFAASDVVLRHLKTAAEIASVVDLREEIDLSVHAAAGPQFHSLEKKETKSVSSSLLTSTASGSAPSASFR